MAREMKDSGFAWIKEIPLDWGVYNLRYKFTFGKGLPITKENLKETGISVISYGQIHSKANTGTTIIPALIRYVDESYLDSNSDSLVHSEDFIFADTSEDIEGCGNCVYVDTDELLFAGYHTIILRSKEKENNRYLAYLFKSDIWRKQIRERVTGVKLFSISQKILRETTIILPPKTEQITIANFLDTECARIDAVIEQTRASIEEYKKLKQAVITQAVTKGIRPNRPMKDSGVDWIGAIANDFQVMKLKYICDILDNFRSPITADQRNQDAEILYDYYGASGAIDKIDGYTIDDHVMLIGEDGANLRMRNLPLMYEVNGKAWINNHAHILKPKNNIQFYYLFFALEALDINPYITGSAQPKLSQENLQNIWVPVPSCEEQIEIVNYIQNKINVIDAIKKKKEDFLNEMDLYKKSVIFEYVTGKKEVPL